MTGVTVLISEITAPERSVVDVRCPLDDPAGVDVAAALPELGWGALEELPDLAREMVRVLVAALIGDLGYGEAGLLQEIQSAHRPQPPHIARRRDAEMLAEGGHQILRRRVGRFRQHGE